MAPSLMSRVSQLKRRRRWDDFAVFLLLLQSHFAVPSNAEFDKIRRKQRRLLVVNCDFFALGNIARWIFVVPVCCLPILPPFPKHCTVLVRAVSFLPVSRKRKKNSGTDNKTGGRELFSRQKSKSSTGIFTTVNGTAVYVRLRIVDFPNSPFLYMGKSRNDFSPLPPRRIWETAAASPPPSLIGGLESAFFVNGKNFIMGGGVSVVGR